MNRDHDRGTFDWLVELAGSMVPATAAAFAATRLAPTIGVPVGQAVLAAFTIVFALAFGILRLVPAEPRRLRLPQFEQPVLPDDVLSPEEAEFAEELLLSRRYLGWDELLLDQPVDEPVELSAVAELLLDDPLPAAEADSRVVQLFAPGRMPTAGQLQRRIDRHLAGEQRMPPTSQDASDALSEALAELRRSLRQA